jgi:uncharacterized damage-inducible protein DinB
MAAHIRWVDRKFEFNFPAGLYPELIKRLRGTPARLEERVATVPAFTVTRRDGDSWSIQENVGHLFDLEDLWLGRLDDYEKDMAMLRPADITNRKTTEANHNARAMNDILVAFRLSRLVTLNRLEGRGVEYFERSALHPRLKQPMRVVDLLFFVSEHDDYHLARISELIREFRS